MNEKMRPVEVCEVKSETLSDGSKVWNVEFISATVACRSDREAIFLANEVKTLIANCSVWISE